MSDAASKTELKITRTGEDKSDNTKAVSPTQTAVNKAAEILEEANRTGEDPGALFMKKMAAEMQDNDARREEQITEKVMAKISARRDGDKQDRQVLEEFQEQRNKGGIKRTKSLMVMYGGFFDERTLLDPKAIFYGADYPFRYLYLPMDDSTASRNYRKSFEFEGYRPANIQEFREDILIGEDAVVLGINRDPKFLMVLARRGVLPPPDLKPGWNNKVGFVTPPTSDSKGHIWLGEEKLYVIEAEIQKELRDYRVSRAVSAESWHKTPQGQQGSGGVQERVSLSIDEFLNKDPLDSQ